MTRIVIIPLRVELPFVSDLFFEKRCATRQFLLVLIYFGAYATLLVKIKQLEMRKIKIKATNR
jgi:hypothetical protein